MEELLCPLKHSLVLDDKASQSDSSSDSYIYSCIYTFTHFTVVGFLLVYVSYHLFHHWLSSATERIMTSVSNIVYLFQVEMLGIDCLMVCIQCKMQNTRVKPQNICTVINIVLCNIICNSATNRELEVASHKFVHTCT